MDPVPSALFRREMGWSAHLRPYDRTRLLTHFERKEEDFVFCDTSSIDELRLYDENGDELNPVYSMDFSSGDPNIIAVGYESGAATLIDTQLDVKNRLLAIGKCHDSAIFSVSWSPIKRHYLATGSGDQTVKVWDCSREFEEIRTFKGHERTVKKVVFHPSQPDVVVSASRDGAIRVWDMRSPSPSAENYITFAHSPGPTKKTKPHVTIKTEVPVTDVVFQDDNILISCGSHDGYAKFWDLRRTYKALRMKLPVRKIKFPVKDRSCIGFSTMTIDNKYLFIATAGKEIFKFNVLSDTDLPEATFENNENMLFDLKMSLSPCGRYLGCGSRSKVAPIWDTWNTSSAHPFTYLPAEANCVLFAKDDPLKAVTGDDNGNVSIWRVNLENTGKGKDVTTISSLDHDHPPKSEIMKRYLLLEDRYPRFPNYKKVKKT